MLESLLSILALRSGVSPSLLRASYTSRHIVLTSSICMHMTKLHAVCMGDICLLQTHQLPKK